MSFHHDSTALEVIDGHDLTGCNVIITGSNSGIGVETARAMAKSGANVFMTCRDVEKAKPIAEDIMKTTGNTNVHLEQLDLDSLASVKTFIARSLANANNPNNSAQNQQQRTLTILQQQPQAPSTHKPWHEKITNEMRRHLVQKIIQTIFPTQDHNIYKDPRLANLVNYAVKTECQMYEEAHDQEEYFHLLAERIYKIQKEFETQKVLPAEYLNKHVVQVKGSAILFLKSNDQQKKKRKIPAPVQNDAAEFAYHVAEEEYAKGDEIAGKSSYQTSQKFKNMNKVNTVSVGAKQKKIAKTNSAMVVVPRSIFLNRTNI